MSPHATADVPDESTASTILDRIPDGVWTAGGSRDPSDAQTTEADLSKELPTPSSTNNKSQGASIPWSEPDWTAIAPGGRRAKSFQVDYFARGVSYSTEIVNGEQWGHWDYGGPSIPGTLTAAIDSNGIPDLSRAFIILEGKDGEIGTMICLGTDVPKTIHCYTPDAGYAGWGGSHLSQVEVGVDDFQTANAILYYPGAPAPVGTSRISPMSIPSH